MTKYTPSFKQQVIEFYLQNGKNRSLTRQHFQLAEKRLTRWINQYNHSGINGVAVLGKKRIYSPEFKLAVVQAVKNGQFSAEYAYLYFGIANSGIIIQWFQAFDKLGINSLFPKPNRLSDNETEIPEDTPQPPKIEEEHLRYRILELEAENAILKKLQEINQSKIAGNLLARNFYSSQPNEKWVADVTEFKYVEGKVYLSPKELFNGEIIAYDLERTPNI